MTSESLMPMIWERAPGALFWALSLTLVGFLVMLGVVDSQAGGKGQAEIAMDRWEMIGRHQMLANSPERVYQIYNQTCDVVVSKIPPMTPGGCEADLDPDGGEVPDPKLLPSPAGIISFVSREGYDRGSEVQTATIKSSR